MKTKLEEWLEHSQAEYDYWKQQRAETKENCTWQAERNAFATFNMFFKKAEKKEDVNKDLL